MKKNQKKCRRLLEKVAEDENSQLNPHLEIARKMLRCWKTARGKLFFHSCLSLLSKVGMISGAAFCMVGGLARTTDVVNFTGAKQLPFYGIPLFSGFWSILIAEKIRYKIWSERDVKDNLIKAADYSQILLSTQEPYSYTPPPSVNPEIFQ